MTRHLLSKSTFLRGCQCHKSLWLYKHKYEARDEENEGLSSTFSQGITVGELARDLFPGGVDASPSDHFHFQESVADTKRYIEQGKEVIYEAAFQFEGVLVAIDILVKQLGKWYAYEVKGSTTVKETFIQDAALQYYVITGSGVEIQDIYVTHINNKYVRQGKLELEQLFISESVLQDVRALQPFIAEKIIALKAVVKMPNEPEIPIGIHCNKPYNCDYIGYCNTGLEEATSTNDSEEVTRVAELTEFISNLNYPLHYMDFETFCLTVPEHDGHWPFRQVPFQFSVHVESMHGKELKHHQYIATPGTNPTREFVETLISSIGRDGSVVVYNKTFENTRLNELKNEFPEFYDDITLIQNRIIDLMVPFRKKHYSHPAMNGSYSIKAVLPAMVPEYSYKDLNITNGADASAIYYNLKHEKDKSIIEQTMLDLFSYCKLDTMAMVKILHKLKEMQ